MKKPTKQPPLTFGGKRLKPKMSFGIRWYANKAVELSPCGNVQGVGRMDDKWVASLQPGDLFEEMSAYAPTPQQALDRLERRVLRELRRAARLVGYSIEPNLGYLPRRFS